MQTPKSVPSVLENARRTLKEAAIGLEDLLDLRRPDRRKPGLSTLIQSGRNVTFVLQNLRAVDREGFNQWYAPYEAEMRQDPLMRYFCNLRTPLVKEGELQVATSMFSGNLNIAELMNEIEPPHFVPEGGHADLVIGDENGASGWIIHYPNGMKVRQNVGLPVSQGIKIWLTFKNPPTMHLGEKIEDTSVEKLAEMYYIYLSRMFADAESHFAPKPS